MKPKKCKVCKKVIENPRPLQQVCSPECSFELIKQNKAKSWRKEKKQRKEALKTRSDYLNELQVLVNRYVLLRDKGQPCISCGTTNPNIVYHAGHFRSKGAYPSVRFNLDNIHRQCGNNCNKHLSGNPLEYRPRLIEKIGIERFNKLEKAKNKPLKITIEEIQQLKTYFRKKIKELN